VHEGTRAAARSLSLLPSLLGILVQQIRELIFCERAPRTYESSSDGARAASVATRRLGTPATPQPLSPPAPGLVTTTGRKASASGPARGEVPGKKADTAPSPPPSASASELTARNAPPGAAQEEPLATATVKVALGARPRRWPATTAPQ